MKCAYCKKRIKWFERLLLKMKLIHRCDKHTMERDYKYAVIAGFRRVNGDLRYVSTDQLIAEHKLKVEDCLRILTGSQRAAYANIIKELKVIEP